MDQDALDGLLKEGFIDPWTYQTYCLYMGDEFAAGYLKNSIESVYAEEPPLQLEHSFAYQAGRISIWRDVRKAIVGVNNLLQGKNYDGTDRHIE